MKPFKRHVRSLFILGTMAVLAFSGFCAICRSAGVYEIQPLFEANAPYIDGVREDTWLDYVEKWEPDTSVSEVVNDFSDLVEIYVLYHDDDAAVDWLYVGIYFSHVYPTNLNETYDTFALFLSNEEPDSSNLTTDIWSYDDIKAVCVNGSTYDQYIDSDQDPTNPGILDTDDIVFAFDYDESSAFFEFKFPLSGDPGEDVSWEAGNKYTMRLLYGDTFENEAPYRPDYNSFDSTGKITVKLGRQPGESDFEDEPLWWERIGEESLDSFIAKIVLFVIATFMFLFIGSYVLNSRKSLGRV